jgi:hypothetical protein
MRKVLLAGLFSFVCLSPALAEGTYSVTASEDMKDGMTVRGIHFTSECGDECLAASLSCGGAPRLEAELIDIPSEEAAKAIGGEQSLLILGVAGQKIEMPITRFTFSEMNGSWDASAYGTDPDAAFKLFARAKDFTLSVGTRSEKLPVTPEVKAWAEACLK